jgi:hypothetical protein
MNSLSGKMDLAEIRKVKDLAKSALKEEFSMPKSLASLALVHIEDVETREFILQGLSAIGIGAIVVTTEELSVRRYSGTKAKLSANELYGFDCVVYDGDSEGLDLTACMRAGVVPITSDRTVFSAMLSDFNPMKFEGNGFFFRSNNPYCIFEKIVSYCENIKFPEDRRILLKHVTETF